MVSHPKPDFSTPESRLDYVRLSCKCPKKSVFALWVGAKSPQSFGKWEDRGPSKNGAIKISQVTGASVSWLLTGEGVPFPDGPKIYQGALPSGAEDRLQVAEDQVDAIGVILTAIVKSITSTQQVAGAALEAALRALPVASDSQQPVLKAVIDAAAAGRELMGPATRRAVPAGSSGKLPRKGH